MNRPEFDLGGRFYRKFEVFARFHKNVERICVAAEDGVVDESPSEVGGVGGDVVEKHAQDRTTGFKVFYCTPGDGVWLS